MGNDTLNALGAHLWKVLKNESLWALKTLSLKAYRHYRHEILSYIDIYITGIIYYGDINKYICKIKKLL